MNFLSISNKPRLISDSLPLHAAHARDIACALLASAFKGLARASPLHHFLWHFFSRERAKKEKLQNTLNIVSGYVRVEKPMREFFLTNCGGVGRGTWKSSIMQTYNCRENTSRIVDL